MDEEGVVQLLRGRAVETQHLLAQRLFHVLREVVKEAEQVLEADELTEVIRCHHDLR